MRDWVVSEFAAPGTGLGPVLTLNPQAPAGRAQIRLASNRSDLLNWLIVAKPTAAKYAQAEHSEDSNLE